MVVVELGAAVRVLEAVLVLGTVGHLSWASGMPSPSLSRSGQPSPSSKPSMSSARAGTASTASGMPSPSESRLVAGQPSCGYGGLPSSGSFGHLSCEIRDAVLVVVEVGAAVVVLEAVDVLGLVRALVVGVGAAIAVVVVVGAAVFVLEAVLVLGDERALVAAVRDAVAVGVADVGRVADARGRTARSGEPMPLIEAGAAAEHDRDRAGRADAQAALDLERARVEREARQAGAAVALGDQREPVGDPRRAPATPHVSCWPIVLRVDRARLAQDDAGVDAEREPAVRRTAHASRPRTVGRSSPMNCEPSLPKLVGSDSPPMRAEPLSVPLAHSRYLPSTIRSPRPVTWSPLATPRAGRRHRGRRRCEREDDRQVDAELQLVGDAVRAR